MLQVKNDKFKILQFTDIHIGEFPFNDEDELTFKMISKTLKETDADLIVVTGDLIWSSGVKNPIKGYQALIEIFNQYPIPIAVTYGNHDSEESITRTDLRKEEENLKYRVPKINSFIDSTNKETFNLEITDDLGKLVHVLYFFDSGSDSLQKDIEGYDWVTLEQVDHYNTTFVNYAGDGYRQNDVVFLHIPLQEYVQAGEHILEGKFWEQNPRVAYSALNTGLFSRIEKNGNVLGTFCGHDHDNNFSGVFGSQHLIYGNVSGYNCYGDLKRGYREIILSGNKLETVIKKY